MILEATACIGVPAAALWVRTVGLSRILAVISASAWATAQAIRAGGSRYREVYRASIKEMERDA